MKFSSPWQSAAFVRLVAITRRLLRPFGRAEQIYIDRLTDAQNRRVHRYLAGLTPKSVLLIMPRCVKLKGCHADVQHSLEQCADCRLCPLGNVARLCARFEVRALVAFRSHIAYEMAREHRPDLIIATACHDRIVKALRSVPRIPALLAPLAGMERQCVNAGVDLGWLEGQLVGLTRRGPSADEPASADEGGAGARAECPATRAIEGS